MQNTSLQPSAHHTIPQHVKIILNTGSTLRYESSQHRKPESLASLRNILYSEEMLQTLPFGQIKYQSRRRGSFLNCAFSYQNAQLYACAVSSQGRNRQFWGELVDDYSFLQKANAVLGCPGNTLKPPKHSPWIATFTYAALVVLLREPEWIQLFTLMDDLAITFLIDSETTPAPNSAPVNGEGPIM